MSQRNDRARRLPSLAVMLPPKGGIPSRRDLLRSALLLLVAFVLLVGCASVPKDYPRTESSAFQDHHSTTLGRYVARAAAR